jgi:hypothetical protein
MKKINHIATVLFATAGMLVWANVTIANAQSAHQPKSVVELYSSQGCSSCPPADKFLGELITDKEILGLTFSVTYWDYIGWKDTFGNKDNDSRQANYKKQFSSRYVYTPQIIVGGTKHKVGSDSHGVKSLINDQSGHAKMLPLTWEFSGDTLDIKLPDGDGEATIWLVDINRQSEVDIGRGENSGRKITYYNIVRQIRSLGIWNGKAETVSLDLAEMKKNGRDGCALIVQRNGYGPIIAALNVEL